MEVGVPLVEPMRLVKVGLGTMLGVTTDLAVLQVLLALVRAVLHQAALPQVLLARPALAPAQVAPLRALLVVFHVMHWWVTGITL